jgi:BirA family transcriptional regulator, biotin operon repressor / biotin---[acetyl-CoA-carboxylase] ligase
MSLDPQLLDNVRLRSILECLADGQYHSGEYLGHILGVSRAAVWKHLQKLESLGINIQSVKGKGYVIEGGLELLDKQKILSELSVSSVSVCKHLDIFSIIDSTNSYILAKPDIAGHVCIAEAQTAGRGRRGRVWHSPFAQNIYMSLGWGFEGGVAALEGLSLAVGVALVRALNGVGIEGVSLKWPNDVLYKNKKLAGILIEMMGDPAGYCQAVIGIGLNVRMATDDAKSVADQAIQQPWIDVQTLANDAGLAPIPRNRLAASLINELLLMMPGYSEQGFSAYRLAWDQYNAHAGQWIDLHSAQRVVSGIMLGVNEQGALRLQTSQGEELFYGGEVSLRTAS